MDGEDGAPQPNVPVVTAGNTGGSSLQSANPGAYTSASRIPTRYKVPKELEPLDGSSTWDAWCFRLRNVFEAEDAWGVVNGTEQLPTTDPDKILVWKAKDKAAQITINLALSTTCIPLVENAKTAAVAWKALSDAYCKKGLLTAYYYRSQVINFCFNDSQPSSRNSISYVSYAPSKSQLVFHLKTGTSPSVSLLPSPNPIQSFASPFSLMTQEEIDRKRIQPNVDSEAAFALRQGNKTHKGQPRKEKKPQDKTGASQAQQGADKSNQKHAEKNRNKPGKGDSTPVLDGKTWVAKICDDDDGEEAKAIGETTPTGSWWEFNSGATRVFHGDLNAFSDYTPFVKPVNIGLATDGASTKAFGSGTLRVRFFPPNSSPVEIPITKAYYAPGIMSLISISYLDDLG
ncbi:hypothetical protein FRC00_010424 [Tulasnella sp. 408]|nr:hypothetical protein FRC00_010424 [Tulasnella sp. 408]